MLLSIDIGNTNMEFGVFQGKTIKAKFRLGTNRNITSDEIGLFLSQFLLINGMSKSDIQDIIIATVVPQVMYSVNNAMKKYIGKTPIIVGEDLPYGIENRYERPGEVGADRLVNAVAAYLKYGGPLIIVDFGTATTFDAVSDSGAYLGGAIYPGVKISMDALFEKTAKLPRVELIRIETAIGRRTVNSVQAGIMFGYAGAVTGIVAQMSKELGGNAKVIGTGGLSGMIGEQCPDLFHSVDRNLTLDGLQAIYEQSK